jgi:hypothetical protein
MHCSNQLRINWYPFPFHSSKQSSTHFLSNSELYLRVKFHTYGVMCEANADMCTQRPSEDLSSIQAQVIKLYIKRDSSVVLLHWAHRTKQSYTLYHIDLDLPLNFSYLHLPFKVTLLLARNTIQEEKWS